MKYCWGVSNDNPQLPAVIPGMDDDNPIGHGQGSQPHPTRIHGPGRSSRPVVPCVAKKSGVIMGGSINGSTPVIIHFDGMFHYQPSIFGYPPFMETSSCFPYENWPWGTPHFWTTTGKYGAMSRWKPPPDRLFYWSRILPLAAPAYDHLVKCGRESVGIEIQCTKYYLYIYIIIYIYTYIYLYI